MRFFYSLKLEKNERVPFIKGIYLFLIFKSNSKSLIKRIKLKNTIFTKKKLRTKISLLFALMLLLSCKTMYKTLPFSETPIPEAPDYTNNDSWAVLPGQYPEELISITGKSSQSDVDVFFVYPTLLTDKKDSSWNADFNRDDIRKNVLTKSVKFQASSWAKAGNIYVPFYRQSHYKTYVEPYDLEGPGSWKIAYQDISKAFAYYLEHYNKGNGIIIAAHSQGSIMAKELIKDFFDDKELQNQLVAAYLPGVRVKKNELGSIQPMYQPEAIGGFVSWNTYKKKNYPKTYEQWYKGGVTTNPITWDKATKTLRSEHLGTLNSDGKIYDMAIGIEIVDGLIWSTVPRIPKRFLLSFVKSYHFADVNLFWKDIEVNAQLRAKTWLELHKTN